MYIIERECEPNSIFELEKLCFQSSYYNLAQIIEMSGSFLYQIIALKLDDKYLAYTILFDNSENLEIMKIATHPEYRKKGLGKILLEEVLKYGKSIFLEVRENNITAREFYKNNGFIEVGKRKNYYPDTKEAAIIMLKEHTF